MNLSHIELPSNRKFGFFFSGVFAAASFYFYFAESIIAAFSLGVLCIVFLIVTILSAELLLPFNKLWIRFGLLLGMIVSPIVLGIIFFGIFTPISLAMRLFKRDELRLCLREKNSYWIFRNTSDSDPASFKNQF